MFARVSTYQPAPDSTGEPSADTVRQVLELPGCRGIYYLHGQGGKSLSLTLWDDADALAASRPGADRIRAETTTEQNMEVLGVAEFEVLTNQLTE